MKTIHKVLLSVAAGMAISAAGIATANADHINVHHTKNVKKANANQMATTQAPAHSNMKKTAH